MASRERERPEGASPPVAHAPGSPQPGPQGAKWGPGSRHKPGPDSHANDNYSPGPAFAPLGTAGTVSGSGSTASSCPEAGIGTAPPGAAAPAPAPIGAFG